METVPPGTCHSKTSVAFENMHVCQNDIDPFQIGDPNFEHSSKDSWKAECRLTLPAQGESPGKASSAVSPCGWRALFLMPQAALPIEEEKMPQRKQSPCSFIVSALW